VLSAFVGALAGFWIAILGRLFLSEIPVPFTTLVEAAIVGIGSGILLGTTCPKVLLILGFPFALFGTSS
jgi:hypothetical protein